MNPTTTPTTTPTTPNISPERKKKSLLWPIVLMVWPIASIVIAVALYAIVNFIFTATAPAAGSDDLFNEGASNPFRTILNVILFLVGGSAVTAGPISFIAGLVLLIINLNKK